MEEKKQITVAVSGGFDPIHIGHVRLMKEAKALGDKLIVVINNDNWLKKKKGFNFMPENDRVEIIKSLRCVDNAVLTEHPENPTDMSVCDALKKLHPDIFANGGDRKVDNVPEVEVCKETGVEMLWRVGGGKVQSSSDLIKNAEKEN